MNYLKNFYGHLSTILHHKNLVRHYCFKAGLYKQGIMHDWSKYNPIEFFAGVKYYQGGKRSPNFAEKEDKKYSSAWLHHKGRNKHHFEYWNDYNPKEKRVMPVKMPARYLAEMFCDRLAASKVYAGDQYQQDRSLRYFQNSNARKRGMLHPETEAKLMELLEILAQQGEEAAFAAVRELVKKGY